MALTGLDLAFYFGKTVWQVGVLPYYPQWPVNPPSVLQFWPWPVMGAIAWWFWHNRQTWGRHALLGLGYFVIMLVPFVTLNVGGYATYTWVMDHFLYFPILGPIALAVAGLGELALRFSQPFRILQNGLIAAVMIVMAWGSRDYATQFANPEALCEYTLRSNPDCWVLHYNLAVALVQKGEIDEGISHYRETLRLRPNDIDADYNWGIILLQQKRPEEAIPHFENNLKYAPNDVRARNNLGGAFMMTGQYAKAVEQYEAALQIMPGFVDGHYNLGNALVQQRRYADAIAQYQIALNLSPNLVLAWNGLGIALSQIGRLDEAKVQFQKALQIDPSNDVARADLTWLQEQTKQPTSKK
jgi:tetratricopeptide (TPR) repeat protein